MQLAKEGVEQGKGIDLGEIHRQRVVVQYKPTEIEVLIKGQVRAQLAMAEPLQRHRVRLRSSSRRASAERRERLLRGDDCPRAFVRRGIVTQAAELLEHTHP